MVKLNRPKDVYAGLIFLGSGIATFLGAQQYEVGSAGHMGPGYLPALMGVFLAILGGCSLLTAFRHRSADPIERQPLEPFVLVVASVIAFALLIDRAGVIAALFAMVFISCLRRAFTNPFEVLMIFVLLTAFCVGVFRYALNLPLPL